MDGSFRENWDEFTWSREIRKDELRIAGYFRALVKCLDLPGEEELIFSNLMSHPEMVPTGVTDPNKLLNNGFDSAEEDEDWDGERREARRSSSFDAGSRLENLALEWNIFAASRLSVKHTQLALAVTCAFGKVLSRIYNYEDVEDNSESTALQIGLLKRLLADLNELLRAFDDFKTATDCEHIELEKFFPVVCQIRESVIGRLKNIK